MDCGGWLSIGTGPVVGGLLIASLGWRSIFLVNLPVCAVGAALTLAFASESDEGTVIAAWIYPARALRSWLCSG